MKNKNTPLVDQHLEAFSGMQEASTDDFFYTRLKARMDREAETASWSLPLRPVWVIGTLLLFLAVNTVMLTGRKEQPGRSSGPLQQWASSYDQTITTTY